MATKLEKFSDIEETEKVEADYKNPVVKRQIANTIKSLLAIGAFIVGNEGCASLKKYNPSGSVTLGVDRSEVDRNSSDTSLIAKGNFNLPSMIDNGELDPPSIQTYAMLINKNDIQTRAQITEGVTFPPNENVNLNVSVSGGISHSFSAKDLKDTKSDSRSTKAYVYPTVTSNFTIPVSTASVVISPYASVKASQELRNSKRSQNTTIQPAFGVDVVLPFNSANFDLNVAVYPTDVKDKLTLPIGAGFYVNVPFK